jgi:hypothetical protein
MICTNSRVVQIAPETNDPTPRIEPREDDCIKGWIEPGEDLQVQMERPLPNDVQTVKVTSFAYIYPNSEAGWRSSTIYDLVRREPK